LGKKNRQEGERNEKGQKKNQLNDPLENEKEPLNQQSKKCPYEGRDPQRSGTGETIQKIESQDKGEAIKRPGNLKVHLFNSKKSRFRKEQLTRGLDIKAGFSGKGENL